MKDNSRRSFVKKTAATGLTFTFAGLIRAHGESGGGETTFLTTVDTTWDPNGGYTTTNSGQTTTWDPMESSYSTTEQETTWDPMQTTSTTEPETTAKSYKAQFSMHNKGEESKTFFKIGEEDFMLKIWYQALDMDKKWWNVRQYKTYFLAQVFKKMFDDVENGEYSGEVSPVSGHPQGKSVTRKFAASCNSSTGDLSINDILAIATDPLDGQENVSYPISGVNYKLRILLTTGQTTDGGNFIITRDKGSAILSKIEVVNGQQTDVNIASVDLDKNFAVKNWYPQLHAGDPLPSKPDDPYTASVDESEEDECPDAALKGCFVKFHSELQ